MWGNYSTGSSAYNNINIWMTSDKGKTVRSTYKFRDQRSDTDNPILFARHMHRVDFCPLDNTLWAQSGDHSRDGVREQHWLLGRYDHLTDTLTWEHLRSGKFAASGNRFKSLNIDWRQGPYALVLRHGGVSRRRVSSALRAGTGQYRTDRQSRPNTSS